MGWAQLRSPESVDVDPAPTEFLGSPIRTAEGSLLVARRSEDAVRLAAVSADSQMREGATLRGDGEIVDFDLAPGPTSPALAVIGSCPEGFGSQRANDEFKQCIGPLQFASMELDELGRQSGERVPLPTDASEGALFSSRRVSVWDDRDGKPAVYAQGSWQNVRTDPPSTSGTVDRCASQDHFWLLTGTNGPRSLTGQDNAVPMESNYELFRMRLDGSLDNPWER